MSALLPHVEQQNLIKERLPGVTLGSVKSNISSMPSIAATFISEPIFMNISNVAFDFMQGIFSKEVSTVMAKAIVASTLAEGAMAAGPAIAITASSLAVSYVLYRKLNQNAQTYFELIDAINAYTILLFRIQHNLDVVERARNYYGFSSIDNSEDLNITMTEIIIYFKSLISPEEASKLQDAFLKKKTTVDAPGFFSKLSYMWSTKHNLFKNKSEWLSGFNVLVMKLTMIFSLYMNEFQLSLQIHQSASSIMCNQLYAASMANSEAFQCMTFAMIYQPFIMFREGLLACMMSGSSSGCARLIDVGERSFAQKYLFIETEIRHTEFDVKFFDAMNKINQTIIALETAKKENVGHSSYGSKLTPQMSRSDITKSCSISIYTDSFVSYMRAIYNAIDKYIKLPSTRYTVDKNNISIFIILCNQFYRLMSNCSKRNASRFDHAIIQKEEGVDIFNGLDSFSDDFDVQRKALVDRINETDSEAKEKIINMIMPMVDDRVSENISVINMVDIMNVEMSDQAAPAADAAADAAAADIVTSAQQLSNVIDQMFPMGEETKIKTTPCSEINAFYHLICKQSNIDNSIYTRGADQLLDSLLEYTRGWIQTTLHHFFALQTAIISHHPGGDPDIEIVKKITQILEVFYQINNFFMSDENLKKQYKSERNAFFSGLSKDRQFMTPTTLLLQANIITIELKEMQDLTLQLQTKPPVGLFNRSKILTDEPLLPAANVDIVRRFKAADITKLAKIVNTDDVNFAGSIKWLVSIANMTINYINSCIINKPGHNTNIMHKVINQAFFGTQTQLHKDAYPELCDLLEKLRMRETSNTPHVDYDDLSSSLSALRDKIEAVKTQTTRRSKGKMGGTRRFIRFVSNKKYTRRGNIMNIINSKGKTLRRHVLRKAHAHLTTTSRAGKYAQSTSQRSSRF